MITLKYIASSGNEYNLKSDGIRTKTANYHTWNWGTSGTELQFGRRISGFTRDAAEYETKLVFTGPYSQRKALSEALHDDFELDVRNLTPGRIVWGDYYLDCYITSSSMYPDEDNVYTDNDITIFAPHPFWVREATKQFFPQEAPAGQSFLEYTYDYDYDFFYGNPGIAVWQTGCPFKSEFLLTIYGEVVNPRILINNYPYQVNVSLEANERIVIDSRNNTITQYLASGSELNIFDLRDKSVSVFEPVPDGTLRFNWSGAFGFDLTIFDERSEPRWITL